MMYLRLCLTAVIVFNIGPSGAGQDAESLYFERTCIACHGKDGKHPAMSEYPIIAGQNEVYLIKQMQDIKTGARANAHSAPMKNGMHLISDEEIEIVAKWLASLE